MKKIKSSEFSRKQLIALIANLRGSLFTIQNNINDKLLDEIREEVEYALVMSAIELQDQDLENKWFPSLPLKVFENLTTCVSEQEKRKKK